MTRLGFIFLLLCSQISFGQNNVLNTWAFHEHSDTNIYLSLGSLDRTMQSSMNAGRWVDGTTNAAQVNVFDVRDSELLTFAYSTPKAEIGFTTGMSSLHSRSLGGDEFNSLLRGQYDGDTLFMNNLNDVRSSIITHQLKFTAKSSHTIAQLILSGHQINSYQKADINGIIVRSGQTYEGHYTANSIRFNNQLLYQGSVEDQLQNAMSWGDSVRITSITRQPLLPSLGIRLIHRPTQYTQFQLLVSGITPLRSTAMVYRSDSVNFELRPSGIPTYRLFSEEEVLELNNQYEYRRNRITETDTTESINLIPYSAYLAYRVQIEPLLFLHFAGGVERYLGTEFYVANILAERKYQNDLYLQLGLSNYIYNQTIKPNLSAGIRAKISEKLTLMAYSSAATSIPYPNYTSVPRWTNRYHLNVTLQYQLL